MSAREQVVPLSLRALALIPSMVNNVSTANVQVRASKPCKIQHASGISSGLLWPLRFVYVTNWCLYKIIRTTATTVGRSSYLTGPTSDSYFGCSFGRPKTIDCGSGEGHWSLRYRASRSLVSVSPVDISGKCSTFMLWAWGWRPHSNYLRAILSRNTTCPESHTAFRIDEQYSLQFKLVKTSSQNEDHLRCRHTCMISSCRSCLEEIHSYCEDGRSDSSFRRREPSVKSRLFLAEGWRLTWKGCSSMRLRINLMISYRGDNEWGL